jgi:hypothetical protein
MIGDENTAFSGSSRWRTTTISSAGHARFTTVHCAGKWFGSTWSIMVPEDASSTVSTPSFITLEMIEWSGSTWTTMVKFLFSFQLRTCLYVLPGRSMYKVVCKSKSSPWKCIENLEISVFSTRRHGGTYLLFRGGAPMCLSSRGSGAPLPYWFIKKKNTGCKLCWIQ